MSAPENAPASEPAPATTTDPPRFRASAKGKRLFGLLLDLITIVLFLNTLRALFKPEHWDLLQQGQTTFDLKWFYAAVVAYLVLRDANGASVGKFFLGMSVRRAERLSDPPSLVQTLQRNLTMVGLPLEGLYALWEPYGRRVGDRWAGTVVIDNPNAIRGIRRIILANLLFFGSFVLALGLQQPNIRKAAAYQIALEHLQERPDVRALQDEGLELADPEMNLDFRENPEPSVVRFRIDEDNQTRVFDVSLQLQQTPEPRWEILETTAIILTGEDE
jgi:uncharacterized RDD family membrane protein YckC